MKSKEYNEGRRDVLEEIIINLNEARNIADMREWVENEHAKARMNIEYAGLTKRNEILSEGQPVKSDLSLQGIEMVAKFKKHIKEKL